jgi:hypothetical protein
MAARANQVKQATKAKRAERHSTNSCEVDPRADLSTLESVLQRLRALAAPCEPPIGVGAFDVLYANAREIVVWYSPARAEHRAGEVAISTARLEAAWTALLGGALLDEAALERLGAGVAGGRWLLAVLAQLPGVRVRDEPLALEWAEPGPPEASADSVAPSLADSPSGDSAPQSRSQARRTPAAITRSRRR